MNKEQQKFSALATSWRFKLFLLKDLPMGLLAGLRIRELNRQQAIVSLPYKYLTKNPFRSVYFACLAMAGELCSGSLSMLHARLPGKRIAMLVVGLRAEFVKKAVGRVNFTCSDGHAIAEAIETCIRTNEPQTVEALSIGTDEHNNVVARFYITWSYKNRV
jgi:hypothetical protein